MIEANKALFGLLDNSVLGMGEAVANAGRARWLATGAAERYFLKESRLMAKLAFGLRRQVARFDLDGQAYFCTIGFDRTDVVMTLLETDVHAGLATTILAVMKPSPSATAAEIRNIVEYSDRDAQGEYTGHEHALVLRLFPTVRVFVASDVASEDSWRIFFSICLAEARGEAGWIDERLAGTLDAICDLSVLNIPYETLCRSVFDADRSAMFMALYRCLEALYAYTSATSVVAALSLTEAWDDVAAVLEDRLGWYPREGPALEGLLAHTLEKDCERLFEALNEPVPTVDLRVTAAKRIYRLRNALVHYRSLSKKMDFDTVDWNCACQAVAAMVCDIYSAVFPSPSVEAAS